MAYTLPKSWYWWSNRVLDNIKVFPKQNFYFLNLLACCCSCCCCVTFFTLKPNTNTATPTNPITTKTNPSTATKLILTPLDRRGTHSLHYRPSEVKEVCWAPPPPPIIWLQLPWDLEVTWQYSLCTEPPLRLHRIVNIRFVAHSCIGLESNCWP